MGRQQQILARFNESNQWQTSQTAFSNVQPSTSGETAQFVSEEPQQQGNFGASSSTFMHKRTREEDQSEDVNSASTASNPFAAVSSKKAKSNNWIGIPMGGSGGPLVYRVSALKEAGHDKVPTDHAGLLKLCQDLKKINKPAGFALGNAVGDANGFANWMLWSHGGALVDEDGKVIINSKETLNALNFVKELYPTFIPGTMSWNDISNNRAYASNELFFTANGVSMYFALKNDPATKAIADDTQHALLTQGQASSAPMSATVLNAMVFKHTKFPNAAKAYLTFMMEAEQYDPWLTGCLGYWSHPLNAYDKSKVWTSDPKIEIYRSTMNNRFWSGYKGPITQAAGTVAAEYILVQMFASVASGQATPADAAKEAERRTRRYYR